MGNGEQLMDGGCSCRQIRFRLLSGPLFVHCCHCTWCQRESGSAFALNAMIRASEFWPATSMERRARLTAQQQT